MGFNVFDQSGLSYIYCVGYTAKLVFGYGTLF